MTDTLHIPAHIDMTRRIAAQQTADVTRLTVAEAQLKQQYDEHQRDAAAEKARIEAELREMRENAERRLNALDEHGQRLNGELREIGRQIQQHRDEAEQAQWSIADWCTRQGIDPASLPPLPDTGPLPVVPAEPAQVVDLAPFFGEDVVIRTFGGHKLAGHLEAYGDAARIRQPDGQDCYVSPATIVEIQRVAVIEPPSGFDTSSTITVTADPLPPVDDPDGLLAMGQRMADPGATRTDLPTGGEPPIPGEFQGDTDA
jgi:hypothetical protein